MTKTSLDNYKLPPRNSYGIPLRELFRNVDEWNNVSEDNDIQRKLMAKFGNNVELTDLDSSNWSHGSVYFRITKHPCSSCGRSI